MLANFSFKLFLLFWLLDLSLSTSLALLVSRKFSLSFKLDILTSFSAKFSLFILKLWLIYIESLILLSFLKDDKNLSIAFGLEIHNNLL